MRRLDVVVVGSGSAGCVTARRCAELGLRTLLLDRKPRFLVGQKVCGDEISKSHFDETGIDYPKGEEVANTIRGADVYPPNLKNELHVRGWKEFDGWTVNRLSFGQRLLEDAIKAGVAFESDYHVTGPVLRENHVTGINYIDNSTNESGSIRCQLVVDASGYAAVIRNRLNHPLVEQDLAKNDLALCYREILNLKMPLAEPQVARVFLGGSFAPKGYAWIFPKGAQQVNAGVGVTGGKGQGSPKSYLKVFKESYPLLFGSTIVEGKGGVVPVRRPLKSLVADGVAFVGDAALQVNPIHGGGIGPGMRAGVILGEVAKIALAKRNTTAKGLWEYNTRFLSNFGRRLASLEIFRRLLQSVSDDEMSFGFEKRILEAQDLMSANSGDGISLSVFDKMRRMKRGASRPSLLLKLNRAATLMKKINRAYAMYPTNPTHLDEWERGVKMLLLSANFD